MNKDELREAFAAILANKREWDKEFTADGKTYIYYSSRNEFREKVEQPSGTAYVLVALSPLDGVIVFVK